MLNSVVVATPTLGRVGVEYTRSLMAAALHIVDAGYMFGYIDVVGSKYIHQAKNRLIRDFLVDWPQFENFFLWDDDVGATPDKVLEFVLRHEEIIAGIYPMSQGEGKFPVTFCTDPDGKITARNGLCKATRITGGFLKIKRSALEKLVSTSRVYSDLDGVKSWEIFEAGPYAGDTFWSEDSVFAQKWLDLGGELWVDPAVSFEHRGSSVYTGTLMEHLVES